MFHSLLQDKTPKVMHRNSDDFFPDVTDSNPWHVFVNAHNALFDRHLNVVPDWDMFQTSTSLPFPSSSLSVYTQPKPRDKS